MESDPTVNVLYVDDEENNLISFRSTLRRHFNIYTAISGAEAQIVLFENEIHVLITDQRMPGMNGVQLLEESLRHYPDQVRILISGYPDSELTKDAVKMGFIFRSLSKPWNEKELFQTIREAHEVFRRRKEKIESGEAKIKDLENTASLLEQELRQKNEILKGVINHKGY